MKVLGIVIGLWIGFLLFIVGLVYARSSDIEIVIDEGEDKEIDTAEAISVLLSAHQGRSDNPPQC